MQKILKFDQTDCDKDILEITIQDLTTESIAAFDIVYFENSENLIKYFKHTDENLVGRVGMIFTECENYYCDLPNLELFTDVKSVNGSSDCGVSQYFVFMKNITKSDFDKQLSEYRNIMQQNGYKFCEDVKKIFPKFIETCIQHIQRKSNYNPKDSFFLRDGKELSQKLYDQMPSCFDKDVYLDYGRKFTELQSEYQKQDAIIQSKIDNLYKTYFKH